MKPDRIIVGTDNVRTAKLLETLYAPFARSRDKMIVMDVRSAEMTKYAANCMLAAKISFINEIANICERVGANVGSVRRGIGADHRIGYHFIYPGVGLRGVVLPQGRQGADHHRPHERVRTRADRRGGCRQRPPEETSSAARSPTISPGRGRSPARHLALWGLAFKANTDDMREASSLAIIDELTAAGMTRPRLRPGRRRPGARAAAGQPARQHLRPAVRHSWRGRTRWRS